MVLQNKRQNCILNVVQPLALSAPEIFVVTKLLDNLPVSFVADSIECP